MLIKKIQDTSGLETTTVLNTKFSEVENKIPITSSLVATTVLNRKIGKVENKIPDQAKYITTPQFNKPIAENFTTRLMQDNLASKTAFDKKLTSINREIISNNSKSKRN